MKFNKKLLSIMLSAVMVFSIAATTFGQAAPVITASQGLCEHHTAHNADCGYAEGTPCTYQCIICNAANQLPPENSDNTKIGADNGNFNEEQLALLTAEPSALSLLDQLRRIELQQAYGAQNSISAFSLGESTEPFLIANASQLKELATLVNQGNTSFNSAHYTMTVDIDLLSMNWTPIGTGANRFAGTFDGNGKVIKNLTITGGSGDVGLFGYADTVSEIKNLGVESCNVEGRENVGAIVGNTEGTVTGCYATGNVSGVTNVGGAIGSASGTVTNCYATSTVSGGTNAGGAIGSASGTVTNCYATGDVSGTNVGGVIGNASGTVASCVALGKLVTGTNVGKVVGSLGVGAALTDCYAWGRRDTNPSDKDGAALIYNYDSGELNIQFSEIFNGNTAWTFEKDFLPILSNVGGAQSAEIPQWIKDTRFANMIFYIYTPKDLKDLADQVNGGDKKNGAIFILMKDIDLSEYPNWTPIGKDGAHQFMSTFDGNGKVIKNLKITGNSYYAGLFGCIDNQTLIKNLGVENCDVTGTNYVGGLVGYTNCSNITNCYSTGNVKGTGTENVGGLAGYAKGSGSITNCYSTCSVTGTENVGGLVGYAYSRCNITNCYSTGSVSGTNDRVGGLVGYAYSQCNITNCYSTGSVSGTNDRVGGVVGYAETIVTVSNCVALGKTVTGTNNCGRVVGAVDDRSTVANCYAWGGMKIGAAGKEAVVTGGAADNINGANLTCTDGALDKSFQVIFQNTEDKWTALNNTTLPVLKNVGGTQNEILPSWITNGATSTIYITTPEQLEALATEVNGGDNKSGLTFILTRDIDLSGYPNWTPIGTETHKFAGIFDGNGKAVKNLTIIGSPNNAGLFGYADTGSEIKNLGVENCNVEGESNVGGVVGNTDGTVSDCYSTGNVKGGNNMGGIVGNAVGKVSNCYSTGNVNGNNNVGGVVGNAGGVVSNCYSTGSVIATNDAGGVVGNAVGKVSNCYFTGSVRTTNAAGGIVGNTDGANGTVSNCYSTGSVGGAEHVGGIVGNAGGNVSNCVALVQKVTGGNDCGRVVGLVGGGITIADCYAWDDMKIGASGREAIVKDGKADNKNGADLSIIDSLVKNGTANFTWSGFDTRVWTIPATAQTLPHLTNVGSKNQMIPLALLGNIKIYKITASADAGGTITPSGTIDVASGKSETFTIKGNANFVISSVVVDGENKGAINSYTFSDVKGDHSISAKFRYVSSDSEDYSLDKGVKIISSGVNHENTASPTIGEIKVSAVLGEEGSLSVKPNKDNINYVIRRAQEQAKNDGTTENGIAITLDVDAKATANSLSVTLSPEILDSLIKAEVTNLTIKSDFITMSFDLEALKKLRSEAEGDITITATRQDVSKLSEEAQKEIGNRPVFNLSVTDAAGENISDFGDGEVTVSIPYTLQPGEDPNNLQGYFVDAKGKLNEVASKYDPINKCLVFVTNHFSVYGIGYKENAPYFTDIENHWAKKDIEFVVKMELLSGTGNNKFSPDMAMTRGMFVTVLGRLANADVSGYKRSSFTDVNTTDYFFGYVEWAAENGIVKGTSSKTFAPNAGISRQEMAVVMANYAKAMKYTIKQTNTEIKFEDNAKIAGWAAEAVKAMQGAGIIMGRDGNMFDPTATATRGEASAILRRYVELVVEK